MPDTSWKSGKEHREACSGRAQPAQAVDAADHPDDERRCRAGRRPSTQRPRGRRPWRLRPPRRRDRGRESRRRRLRRDLPARAAGANARPRGAERPEQAAEALTVVAPVEPPPRSETDESDRDDTVPREHGPPRKPGDEQQRPGNDADRARQRPAGHVLLALGRRGVHQRRLREAGERAGGGAEDDERRQEDRERHRRSQSREAQSERDTGDEYDPPPPAPVAEEPEWRLDEQSDQPGDRQRDPDLRIAQVEVVPDRRPRGLTRAEDELVEELDREQSGDEAGDSAPAARRALAGRARQAHAHELTCHTRR